MSIQSNFPAARPSLLLDFANTKSLDPRITFSRASTANYYDGKTATKAEQNMFTYSQAFNGNWSSAATLTSNASTAPDGTTTATLYDQGTSTTYHEVYQPNISVTSGTTYVYSFFVKDVNSKYVNMAAYASSSVYVGVIFNLSTGTVTTSNSGTWTLNSTNITYVGNGWYRCFISFTPSTSVSATTFSIVSPNGTTLGNYGLTGSFVGTNRQMYIWGAQLEQRSTVSAYTATTASAITNYIPTLQSAASGVPRFDSNPTTGESLGLLIEESRTNLATASAQFETIVWSKGGSTVAGNIDVGPDGTLIADKLIEDSSTGTHYTKQAITLTASAYTFSVYAKAGERSFIALQPFGDSRVAYFNLSTGTVATVSGSPTSTSITSVGNGWYRCTLTATASSGTPDCYIYLASADNTPTYAGNGYSGVYLWGAQMELGSSATSYVATPLTFTSRASSATYLGPNGYITSAATNVARNQTNSVGTTNLLLEAAASNILTYTEQFYNTSLWPVSGATVAPTSSFSPDGAYNGTKLYGTATTNYISRTISTSVSTTYTFSIYANIPVGSTATMYIESSGGTYYYYSANLVGEGVWQRYSLTFTTNSNNTVGVLVIKCLAGIPYYIWGAQVEAGSTATSYIPSVETWSSRASTATYYNSSGVLATAASGASRTTYNPALLGAGGKLLLEPAATNLCLQSEVFDNATWTKSNTTVSANATTAPDGNATADLVYPSSTGLDRYIRQTTTVSNATTYTNTVYAKANGINFIHFADINDAYNNVWFDLSTGTTSTPTVGTASIQYVGNGWYRCSQTTTSSSTSGTFFIALSDASGSRTSTTSGTNGVYLWGAQLEAGSGATSYIATTTASVTRAADASTSAAQSRSADVYSASTVTRAADAASMTGTNFSSWYRADEGTFYAEAFYTNGSQHVINVNDTTSTSRIVMYGNINIFNANGSSTDASFSFGTITLNTPFKASFVYKSNDYAASLNGATVVTDTSVKVPVVTKLSIGASELGATYINSTIKKIAYYPQRVTNANIQALTS